MGTKIHNLTIYPILENCKFWGVTVPPCSLELICQIYQPFSSVFSHNKSVNFQNFIKDNSLICNNTMTYVLMYT